MWTLSSRHGPLCASFKPPLSVALALLIVAAAPGPNPAAAKTPGETYCFYGTCHRVKSIAETQALVGAEETVTASFYDTCENDPLNPCGLTSSGEVFRADAPDNAASPIYPDGTMLLVWSPESREAVVLRVNNAGPYWGKRKLDVSRATAERLGFADRGVTELQIRVLDAPDHAEATYKRGRMYEPVPGYIGKYDSIDAAHTGMAAVMGLEAMAASLLAPLSGGAVAAARAKIDASPLPLTVPVPATTRIAVDPAPTRDAGTAGTEARPRPAPVETAAKVAEPPAAAPTPVKRSAAKAARTERKRVASDGRKTRPTSAARLSKTNRRLAPGARTGVAKARTPVARESAPVAAIPPNDSLSMFSRYKTTEHRPPAGKAQGSRHSEARAARSAQRDT